MNQIFHHILSTDPVTISCDIDMEKYFIAGEEVTQDEIITALAEAFDNDSEKAVIADELSFIREEMENEQMRERDIQRAFVAMSSQPQHFCY